ncbi:MAG: hypothetical protein AAFY47_11615 [Pseudomonadota bacterium]
MTAVRTIAAAFAMCVATAPVVAQSQSQSGMSFSLRATVPVQCSVRFQPNAVPVNRGESVDLGRFREYCNAPRGYRLVITYTPGTLRNATVQADGDSVTLDGSGRAVLTQASGPRSRERSLQVIPGSAGFDTDRLQLDIVVN